MVGGALTRSAARHDGLDFEILAGGSGKAVVFLHGGGSRASHFRPLMAALAPSCRVVAFDQRGFAGTGANRDTVIDHAHWASDVIAMMDAIGLERATLVGWSMGASVAVNAARLAPERIEAVILLGAPDPAGKVDVARLRLRRDELLALDPATRRERDAEELARQVAPASVAMPGLLEALVADRAATSPELQARAIDGYATRPDLLAAAAQVGCPVWILTGEDDRICPPEAGRAMAAALPHAAFELVPGCGHYYAVEQTAWLAARIAQIVGGDTHDG